MIQTRSIPSAGFAIVALVLLVVLAPSASALLGSDMQFAAGSAPVAVAIGDLNGDLKLDLAAATEGGALVLLAKGDGTFGPRKTYPSGLGSRSVAIADLNGDAKADLALANWSADTVSVLRGNGNGTFQAH